MKKAEVIFWIVSCVIVICSVFILGLLVGFERAYPVAEKRANEYIVEQTDYYLRVCSTERGELTKEEAIQLLRDMQWTHQRWADNPQWYDYKLEKQARELDLVQKYGEIIDLIERKID